MANSITMVFRPRSGHLGLVWEAAVASAVGQFCLIFRPRSAALNSIISVLVILVVVTVVVCQVRRKKRRLRALEEESVARKRKEKANSCEVTPKDLEMGEGSVEDEDLDVEPVTDEEDIVKAKVSFNPLLLLSAVC